jgi:hypothetical protein
MLARVRIFLDSAPVPTAAASAAKSAHATDSASDAAHSLATNSAGIANSGATHTMNDGMNSGATSRTEVAAPESVLAQTVAQDNGTRAGTVRVVVDVRDGVGRIESRDVVCALPTSQWTAVLSGLRPGDFVVLPDSPTTRDGQMVRVEDAAAETEAMDTSTRNTASMSSDNSNSPKNSAKRDPHANH